jgi:hypothetical protein
MTIRFGLMPIGGGGFLILALMLTLPRAIR